MAPVGQVLGHGIFSKTKMCKFHQAGKCAKGLQCPWAHDASELNAAPDLRRTKLCKELIKNRNCTNADCNFAHSDEECRTITHATQGLTDEIPTDFSQVNPEAATKILANEASDTERTSRTEMLDFAPLTLSAEAPDFIPTSFDAEAPAFVPMPSFPPGLEDYVPYSSTSGYPSFHLNSSTSGYPSCHLNESESDNSSNDDIKIDGNTPISELLALSFSPKYRQASSLKFEFASTTGSLGDLGVFPEEHHH
eukprot:TRINITY_DN1484_c0_g1_i1.p1 TRINITY_DN1484_c0_g1~~TRINITY_DN1484_c0_g1_i1.p1  ORF type:complete len:251 (-),score=54.77 TRINITY_DN1484_c0_g1_i1:493-1245(-)